VAKLREAFAEYQKQKAQPDNKTDHKEAGGH